MKTVILSALLFLALVVLFQEGSAIVNGTKAKAGQFPFVALALTRSNGSSEPTSSCSSTIILDGYYVIGSHGCFGGTQNTDFIAGVISSGDTSNKNYQTRKPLWKLSHKNYDNDDREEPYRYHNDMVLVRLETPFKINNFTKPIFNIDPKPNNKTNDTKLYTAGWGSTIFDQIQDPRTLNWMNIYWRFGGDCLVEWDGRYGPTQFCAATDRFKAPIYSLHGDRSSPIFSTTNVNDPSKAVLMGYMSIFKTGGWLEENDYAYFTQATMASSVRSWTQKILPKSKCLSHCNKQFNLCLLTANETACKKPRAQCRKMCNSRNSNTF